MKGTPNKTTSITKAAIANLLTEYHDLGQLHEDFFSNQISPRDRLMLFEKLCQYVMPKMQAVAFTEADEKTKTIEDALIELSKPKEDN